MRANRDLQHVNRSDEYSLRERFVRAMEGSKDGMVTQFGLLAQPAWLSAGLRTSGKNTRLSRAS